MSAVLPRLTRPAFAQWAVGAYPEEGQVGVMECFDDCFLSNFQEFRRMAVDMMKDNTTTSAIDDRQHIERLRPPRNGLRHRRWLLTGTI